MIFLGLLCATSDFSPGFFAAAWRVCLGLLFSDVLPAVWGCSAGVAVGCASGGCCAGCASAAAGVGVASGVAVGGGCCGITSTGFLCSQPETINASNNTPAAAGFRRSVFMPC